jgi:hypothetical protein
MKQSKKSIFSLCVSVINSACSVLIFEIHTCVSKDGFRFSETLTFLTSSKIRKIRRQKNNCVTIMLLLKRQQKVLNTLPNSCCIVSPFLTN